MRVVARVAMAVLVMGVFGWAVGGSPAADDKAVELKVGDRAPSFTSTDDHGKEWKSGDHVGKKVLVIYFYPADFTGGCTKQACGFRDENKVLTDKGVEVIGISADSAKTHAAFKKEHQLPFTLLADEKGEVAKKFGVPYTAKPGKASFKDKVFERGGTIQRWTFVIGKDGKVAFKNSKVNAAGDAKAVAEVVDKLK